MSVRPPATTRRRSTHRALGRLALLLFAVALVFYAFATGDEGLYRVWQRRAELEVARARVARLQAVNDSLQEVLWLLKNDLGYVEKVAREEYGMVKPGEQIFRLRRPSDK